MKNLRIKISLGSFNVELEGESEDVISQLEEIKKNGLGQMVDQLLPIFQQNLKPVGSKEQDNESSEKSLLIEPSNNVQSISPTSTLFDTVKKMLPGSESEWILVYAYFICQNGIHTFTRENLLAKYDESKRNKRSNIKNLSNSIKAAINKGWISQQTDSDYRITPDGEKEVINILSRTESSIKTVRKQNTPKKVQDGNELSAGTQAIHN